ncbi:MAG: IMP dehydrogenase, partial [Kiritimatiellia bacterium]|nr:IMP dehydrogenase [Kiritimatiellia bacterium]
MIMCSNEAMVRFMGAFPEEALTFDDVSLVTQYSDFLPADADLTTRLTRRISMNIPFISAAMDTVTESRMAIAMALMGGIGIIHKNLSAAEQADMVATVKHYLNGLIAKPVTFRDNLTLRHVSETCKARGYSFSGFPIVDGRGRLVGILTSRDVRFAKDPDTKISDVMTRKLVTAPSGTSLEKAFRIMQQRKVGKLPLV